MLLNILQAQVYQILVLAACWTYAFDDAMFSFGSAQYFLPAATGPTAKLRHAKESHVKLAMLQFNENGMRKPPRHEVEMMKEHKHDLLKNPPPGFHRAKGLHDHMQPNTFVELQTKLSSLQNVGSKTSVSWGQRRRRRRRVRRWLRQLRRSGRKLRSASRKVIRIPSIASKRNEQKRKQATKKARQLHPKGSEKYEKHGWKTIAKPVPQQVGLNLVKAHNALKRVRHVGTNIAVCTNAVGSIPSGPSLRCTPNPYKASLPNRKGCAPKGLKCTSSKTLEFLRKVEPQWYKSGRPNFECQDGSPITSGFFVPKAHSTCSTPKCAAVAQAIKKYRRALRINCKKPNMRKKPSCRTLGPNDQKKKKQAKCMQSYACKAKEAKIKWQNQQGDGSCWSWRHQLLLQGREYNFGGCKSVDANEKDRVCTKAYITRPAGPRVSLNTGVFLFKRIRCKNHGCNVFKRGFCIRVNKKVWHGSRYKSGNQMAGQTLDFVTEAFKLVQAHPKGLPKKNICKDGLQTIKRDGHAYKFYYKDLTAAIDTLSMF